MRIFKTKAFHKWTIAEEVGDNVLTKAAAEMEQGLYEANLGGNVYKKRIPMDGRGKKSGARVIVGFKMNEVAIFIYGFAKNQKANVTSKESAALKELAKVYFTFTYSDQQLDELVDKNSLIEVPYA